MILRQIDFTIKRTRKTRSAVRKFQTITSEKDIETATQVAIEKRNQQYNKQMRTLFR
jgi:hypothetical protein